jgi:hypothetical protein
MGFKEGVGVLRKLEGPPGGPLEEYKAWLGELSNFLSYKVGNGSRICFWQDVWCGEMALKLSFPKLYSIARDKDALVSDYLYSFGNYIHWNLSFIRSVQNMELESLDLFLNLLYSLKMHSGEPNKILWTPTCNHGFEVKSYYNFLLPGETCLFPWKNIRKVKSSPRIAFFTWMTAWGKILAIDNL